jgi:hypothetical protein
MPELDYHLTKETVHVHGTNNDLDAAADEDIWVGAGSFATPSDWTAPTAARQHVLVSTSASDTAAGAGARTVVVTGLDSDFDMQSETVTMAGLSDATTVNQYTRINYMSVITAGADAVNDGWITATANTDNTITNLIRPDITVGLISHIGGSITNTAGAASTEVQLWVRPEDQVWSLKHIVGGYSQGGSGFHQEMFIPMVVPGKADVKLRGGTDRNNTIAHGHYVITTPNVNSSGRE